MNPVPESNNYIPDAALSAVIDLAIELGMPLLVTGEPGTGKTKLAEYIAKELMKETEGPLKFNTKTDSQARDLFYSYDAIRHFRDSGLEKLAVNPMDYVEFNALGQAIIDSTKKRRVVLIDEIDKAPRDFSNDLLHEFEHFSFQVKEARTEELKKHLGKGAEVDKQGFVKLAKPEHKPILILTSNSEKNLPDAFMRRVLYHHIQFPGRERLKEIIEANVPASKELEEKMLWGAIDHFLDIRDNKRLRKKPATAELLAWIHVLQKDTVNLLDGLKASGDKKLKESIFRSYALIAKNKEDMARLRTDLGI